jgi:hypothetical protein
VVHQVRLVRKERKAQLVQLALLVQQGHKVQPVQRERQDLPEVEVEHLDLKVQLELLVQLVRQELQVHLEQLEQLEQLERQALRELLVPQAPQVQRAQQDLLALLKQFMERSQFQISTEWLVLRRMEP